MVTALILAGCSLNHPPVKNDQLELRFDKDNNLTSIHLTGENLLFRLRASTVLENAWRTGRTFRSGEWDRTCQMKESFTGGRNNQIDWQITFSTRDSAWTTGICTVFEFPNAGDLLFWTAWGNPDHTGPPARSEDYDISWQNPFVKTPFIDRHLFYGEHCSLGSTFSIPLFSIFGRETGKGFTVLMSPDDDLFDVRIITTSDGKVIIKRYNNRISSDHPVSFTMHIFAHGNDWREVLANVVGLYPGYFHPVRKNALEVSGCGAYSSHSGEIDTSLYHRMGGIVNWKSSFDFPYMGMFVPPVKSDEERWQRYATNSSGRYLPDQESKTSIMEMAAYARKMKAYGYHSLYYFNVTEFGAGIQYPEPGEGTAFRHELFRQANAFLYGHFPDAILFGTHESNNGWLYRTGSQQLNPVIKRQSKPYRTWGGAVAMDIGDPAYREFMLEQARTHVEKFPAMTGICIDRMDWLGEYNHRFDDGVSMIGPHETRAVQVSFKAFMEQLHPVLHDAGKVIFCNPHITKVEYLKYADGIFNEGAFEWDKMNLSCFLALFKPLNNWCPDGQLIIDSGDTLLEYRTWNKNTIRQTPDEFLQKQIFMGVFPMAPFTGNDHSITPESGMIPCYLDYGEMLQAMKGRKWVLVPDVIQCNDAMANILEVPGGYIVPVINGGSKATISLSALNADFNHTRVIHPGVKDPIPVAAREENGRYLLEVPLERGCAMVLITAIHGK